MYRSALSGMTFEAANRSLLKLITPDPCPIRAQYAPASDANIDPLRGTVPPGTDSCTVDPKLYLASKPGACGIRSKFAFAGAASTDPPRRPHPVQLPITRWRVVSISWGELLT